MRGVKPFKLSFVTRAFQHGRQNRLGVGVLAYFDLSTGGLRTDLEMWSDVAPLLGSDVLDVGIPKSRAEILVTGSVFQPHGRPGPTRRARVAVGDLEKVVFAIGDREWKKGVPTEPAPFAEMPLTWDNAFGGEDFPSNPRGKGHAPRTQDDGTSRHPLPNLELPGQLITSPRDRPTPASLGPIDFAWPQRFSRTGTYDRAWLDTLYPGFAADLDWRIWNVASEDQQRERPFAPGEPIVLEHLHPRRPRLESRVPELRARCFVRMRHDGAGEPPTDLFDTERPGLPQGWVMEEVDLRLTTLWLFPALERGVLVWHGAQPCREDDGADVDVLMVAAEPAGTPRPLEHYRHVMEKRTGPGRELAVLNDDDLVPPGEAGMGAEVALHTELCTPKNLAAERGRKEAQARVTEARDTLAAAGLDPDTHGPPATLSDPPPVPPLDQIGALKAQAMEQMRELMERGEAERKKSAEEGRAFYEEVGLDWSKVEEEKRTPSRRGPPTFTADGQRAKMRRLADEAASGAPLGELEHYATDPELYQRWQRAEQDERHLYRRSAHHQWPAFPLSPAESAVRRAHVEQAVAARASMEGWDLTGADLSELDLEGADLRLAFMESTSLRGARLVGARLDGAVLAHADLAGATLDDARLAGANLGKARLAGASARRVDLTDAILDGALFEGACLAEARMPELRLREVELAAVDLTGADLRGANLQKVRVRDVVLAGARLEGAHLLEVAFDPGADLTGANLSNATLVQVSAPGARLAGATMIGLRFVGGGSLDRASLRGADLSKANLRGVALRGADLSGARLDGADLSEADLTGASLSGIRARQSMWIRTVLRDAFVAHADLFEALLSKADVRGADLRGASLYAADLALVHGDEATRLEGANLDRARSKPVRSAS